MTKEELLLKTRAELVDLGTLEEIRIGPKWNKSKMVMALVKGFEAREGKTTKDEIVGEPIDEKKSLEEKLKDARLQNQMLSLELKLHNATKGERNIRDFGEIREETKVKTGEKMIEFTPQIDPSSKKKKPYNIFVQINGVGFGTNKGEKFKVPTRLAKEVYRLISEGYGPGAVTIPNPNLD